MSLKMHIGTFTITTLALMLAATLVGTINDAEAQRLNIPNVQPNIPNVYEQTGGLVSFGGVQTNIDVIGQFANGGSQTTDQTQSNEAHTEQTGSLVHIGAVQTNLAVALQVGGDEQTADQSQSNRETTGGNSPITIGPTQTNVGVIAQIGAFGGGTQNGNSDQSNSFSGSSSLFSQQRNIAQIWQFSPNIGAQP